MANMFVALCQVKDRGPPGSDATPQPQPRLKVQLASAWAAPSAPLLSEYQILIYGVCREPRHWHAHHQLAVVPGARTAINSEKLNRHRAKTRQH